MLVEGRKALVTGSRRGIGRAIAAALAEAGADVGVNDVELDRGAEDTMDMVRRHGRTASWHRADISDSAQIAGMFDAFLETHGRIDILVNNAVGSLSRPFLDVTEEEWDYITGNALKGYFLCSQRAAREMAAQGGGGRIVSLSSVQAFRSWPGGLVYGVCKAGVSRMTMGMAHDLAGHGINCTAVAPGYIDTPLLRGFAEATGDEQGTIEKWNNRMPIGRLQTPAEVAEVILFLASPRASAVTGTTYVVDGGMLTAQPTWEA
jgi:NAD(P)-dependent dehydrogenase (short-subunit alcohol dehydrogenase family)